MLAGVAGSAAWTDLSGDVTGSASSLRVQKLLAAQRGVLNATDVYTYIDNFSCSWASGTPPGYRY